MRFAYNLLPLWLLFAAVAGSTYTPCERCTNRATPSELAKISLRLYASDRIDQYARVLVGDALNLYNLLDTSKPTVIYISGWTEGPESESVVAVVEAYLQRKEHNILIVDYERIAAQAWDYAAQSSNGVGYTLATALNELVAAGLDARTIHIVGHSLGGQIAGYIGRYANFTLPRITGLDPAGPSFTLSDDHLSSTDATFVDVFHTNPGTLGVAYSTATVDYWPNGQSPIQPGCESRQEIVAAASSHARSWAYFVESVLDEDAFIGLACDSYTSFKLGRCRSDSALVMGYAIPTTARGDFYFQTKSSSPYGKGKEGIKYVA